MANGRQLEPGTAIAATCLDSTPIRVYIQDASGGVREFSHSSSGWTGGDSRKIVQQAKPQSPIAVMEWDSGHRHIRLYTLDKENIITETSYDGVWSDGALTSHRFEAAPFSKLSTITWNSKPRVYYQASTSDLNEIREVRGGWSKGRTLPTAGTNKVPLLGTSIASVSWGDSDVRLYYQDEGYNIIQAVGNGDGWNLGALNRTAKPHSPLAAVTWTTSTGRCIRLYYINDSDILQELGFDGVAFASGSLNYSRVEAAPHSKLSAIHWDSSVRLYFQPPDNDVIKEWCCDSGWSGGFALRVDPTNAKAIDTRGRTYSVGWIPYILDLVNFRDYDPSTIDGVGVLVGYFDGKLVGESLKDKKTTILKPNTDGNSYTWVYTPGGAIIYRYWDHDHRSDYVRHSQLGSGKPVKCGGEFRISKTNYMESMLVKINDASGHYKPKGSECLGPVAAKLDSLGIPIDKVDWYWSQ